MDKQTLKQIFKEQSEIFQKKIKIVEREFPENCLKNNKIVVITGIRRCGKSTLLKQIATKYKNYAYFNFEDERLLDFTYHDFNLLLEVLLGEEQKLTTIFFDEIQNIKGWEKFVRRLFTEGYKIFVTGSNAKLLSSEIATSLTGRNMKIILYPFSFSEYLQYKNVQIKSIQTTRENAEISIHLDEYLKYGGFPEVAITHDQEELKQIYQDIIINDLITRFGIRDTKDFRELALYLISNTSKEISFNNLTKMLNFSSVTKVKNYLEYLTEAYLLFMLYKYDYLIKKQIMSERKIYAIDTGIINSLAFNFSKNEGKIIENVVMVELMRRKQEIYFYKGKKECDFIIKEGTNITAVIQVATEIQDKETKQREIEGIIEAMEKFKIKEGILITKSHKEKIRTNNKIINVVPLWEFLTNKT